VNENDARFEFRCWARNFGMVDTRLRRLSDCHGVRESDEIYIVAAGNDDTNIKIRDGTLDVKVLIETRGDFERWRPRTKCECLSLRRRVQAMCSRSLVSRCRV
jgi:hypothetical protein